MSDQDWQRWFAGRPEAALREENTALRAEVARLRSLEKAHYAHGQMDAARELPSQQQVEELESWVREYIREHDLRFGGVCVCDVCTEARTALAPRDGRGDG